MFSQKEAVFNAVSQVLSESDVTFEQGQAVDLSKDQREAVIGIIMTGFEKGQIELKSEQENLRAYTGGLVSNWLRKDKRLNGGGTYKPANPGSRTGHSDAQVKNLRILLSTLPEGSQEYTAVEAKIEERVAEIKAEKAKSKAKAIDVTALPEEFRHLVNN